MKNILNIILGKLDKLKGKKGGVILGYIAMLIHNLASFFLTPLIITFYGDSDFGIYKLVLSITSYFALADLGLSNSIVRYISEYKVKDDKTSEGKFVALILIIDTAVGAVLMFFGLVFYSFIPTIFQNSLMANEIALLQKLFFILVFNGIFSLFINLTSGIIKSYEKFAFIKYINISKTLLRVVAVLILLLSGFQIFAVVLVDAILSFIILSVTWIYCNKHLRVRLNFKLLNLDFAKNILSYSLIVFVDALAFHLFWSTDNFIIGIMMSSTAIAVYSIGTLISSLFFSFSIVVSDVLMPGVVAKVTANVSNNQLTEHMIKIGRIKLSIVSLPIIGFIFLGKSFITFWVGLDYIQAYYVSLLVIIPSMLAGICDVGLYVMWAKNRHKIKSIFSMVISIINIILSVVLVKSYGIIGAAIGTSFAYFVGYNIFNNIYFHKALGLDMKKFFKDVFSKIWITLAGTAFFAHLVTINGSTSIFMFFMQVILITLIYFSLLWFLSLNNNEKIMIKSVIPFM